ncbi:glycosyltransferase [Thermomonas sp.]|jgi:GT2 family glycosyltransferase|uniref:glycosyltransferase n=1 Tax=Thermomonas sp. TaxID=1971895 RepID=UPI00257BF26F|nr:glycosyltransferase [Thermomonas sp.]
MTAAITIHFRDAALTARCVDSLLADGWEPVLVWDNSADEGRSLRDLRARYRDGGPVRFVQAPGNLGFGKGMNAAMADLADGGHAGPMLLINNDAVALPGLREALLAEASRVQPPALVAPRVMQDGKEQGWRHYQPWFGLVTRRPMPGSFPFLSGCALLVLRTDCAAPLFDEDFFMYGEDVELSWRMRRQGGSLALLDRAWVVHAGAASSGQASQRYERFMARSHSLLSRKLAGSAWAGRAMSATKLPFLLLRALLRSVRYGSLAPLRALADFSIRSSIRPTDHVARR